MSELVSPNFRPIIETRDVDLLNNWEVNVFQPTHAETLKHALASTILPLLNSRLPSPELLLNPAEVLLARRIQRGESVTVVSFIDLDGSAFPHPFNFYPSVDNLKRDYRLGCHFVHEIARASDYSKIYTSRKVKSDTPPPLTPPAVWEFLTSHCPFTRPEYLSQIAHLGDFKEGDEWVNRLLVTSNKGGDDPVAAYDDLAHRASAIPDLVYYFGDSKVDRDHSRRIRDNCPVPIKFVCMGPDSRRL